MNTNVIILFVLVFLIAILIAIRISSEENDSDQLVDESICQGDLVEFIQEFDDGGYVFYLGELAWVIDFPDYNHVVVSNKHDGYCASDGCEPFKFCTVPIDVVKKVNNTNKKL